MLRSNSSYDPVALKARLVQRHGSDLGGIVFAAEIIRRGAQDARAAELTMELDALHAEISALSQAAGERRAKSQLRLEATFAAYKAQCNEDAKLDSAEQAQISPLTARSLDIQQQMRNISLPRIAEHELSELALYASTGSERLRSLGKTVPPLDAPPPSELARINMGVGLQKP
jgi:hypothetical protein